jgi:hypothetical protein
LQNNYSFIVQDAVQGFYWQNEQATLHPFAIYYKEDEEDEDVIVIVSYLTIYNMTKQQFTVF